MDDLPISKKEQFGKTFIETAIHIDEKAKLCEHTKIAYKREFLEEDKKLDQIKEDALHIEHKLIDRRE